MRSNPFKVGDVVALNSGSPDLTVTSIREHEVMATWWADDHYETAAFNYECLARK